MKPALIERVASLEPALMGLSRAVNEPGEERRRAGRVDGRGILLVLDPRKGRYQ